MRKTIVLLLILVPASQSVTAADWTVVQTASVSPPTFSMSQQNATSSRQAVNGSVLGPDDPLSSVTQTTNFANANVTLTQSGSATNSNVQTINLASVPSIVQLEQTAENFNTATLTQDITGSDNVQAINYAYADDYIGDATQTVTATSIALTKTATTPAGNVQAVNYMKANRYTGIIIQQLNLRESLVPNDLSASNSGIRINSINGNTVGAISITQTVKARSVEINAEDFPTIILNHISP
ncbi:hypothetical protein [Candidatus Spongiihabitans sp.]|uniref:hypothetical protein n=1 Tax=Candidatus Spongiihabitans sp. TaxID=3101308 RepID=UPI003C6F854A